MQKFHPYFVLNEFTRLAHHFTVLFESNNTLNVCHLSSDGANIATTSVIYNAEVTVDENFLCVPDTMQYLVSTIVRYICHRLTVSESAVRHIKYEGHYRMIMISKLTAVDPVVFTCETDNESDSSSHDDFEVQLGCTIVESVVQLHHHSTNRLALVNATTHITNSSTIQPPRMVVDYVSRIHWDRFADVYTYCATVQECISKEHELRALCKCIIDSDLMYAILTPGIPVEAYNNRHGLHADVPLGTFTGRDYPPIRDHL
jgi:hypothetical protein